MLHALPFEDRRDSAAPTAVAHSSHPDAVRFMLEALRDPHAVAPWRREGFVHLAGTGGPDGVQAVRDARSKPGPRKPWWAHVDVAFIAANKRYVAIKVTTQTCITIGCNQKHQTSGRKSVLLFDAEVRACWRALANGVQCIEHVVPLLAHG